MFGNLILLYVSYLTQMYKSRYVWPKEKKSWNKIFIFSQ